MGSAFGERSGTRGRAGGRWTALAAGLALVAVLALAAVAAHVMPLLAPTTCPPDGASGACARILFLGNSYTATNDLPAVVRRLAASAGRQVETVSVAPGGQTFAGHAADRGSLDALGGSHWDAVVLQEQSQIPASVRARQTRMAPAAATLMDLARAMGAQPILFETWGHRDGWADLRLDYGSMQAALIDGYEQMGLRLGVPVAPVGRAWASVVAAHPEVGLWGPDGSHPSAAGTYLAACVLYAAILGADPREVRDEGGLPADVARLLRATAADVTVR